MSCLRIKIDDDFSKPLAKKLSQAGPRAAHALAIQIAKDTEPFVPARTKSLANRTRVVENRIVYPGPYARYLYYGLVMVDEETGKGPAMYTVAESGGKKVKKAVKFRFRKGAKLKKTDRPLKISQAVHPQAQSHWLEGSRDQNIEKWVRVAGKAVERELKR